MCPASAALAARSGRGSSRHRSSEFGLRSPRRASSHNSSSTKYAPLSRRRAFARYVAAWIGPALAVVAYAALTPHGFAALAWPLVFLNWLAALVDPQRQFLHDRIAGTRLVSTAR